MPTRALVMLIVLAVCVIAVCGAGYGPLMTLIARAPEINPDRVGEELADDARIWRVYDRVAKEDDDRRIAHWNRGLDNLALFAGLLSAVTTAFIIEAQNDMKPDYAQLTFQVLNATSFQQHFVPEPFAVPPSARTVNCLWIASLVLSLSAALIAIMGKDWIGLYTARPICNLRQWAEMRTYRLLCIERWYMSGVIAAAPVLLHVSLLLFGAGLVMFISSDLLTHHLTLGLCLTAGALYLVTTTSAVVFSTSPYKSPATQMIRAALSALFAYMRIATYPPKRNLVHCVLRGIDTMVAGFSCETGLLPSSTPPSLLSRLRFRPAAILSAAGSAASANMRRLASSLRDAGHNLRWSLVKMHLHSSVSAIKSLPLEDWFLSSTWTDLPASRRPEMLADALSWLNGASQAPDVFRALVFALGDLDVGPQVGPQVSNALSVRLKTEIRRTWQYVDFMTLSRYVLADRNTLGESVLKTHLDMDKLPVLRCEDGLAALIKTRPAYMSFYTLAFYLPDHVNQPRMMELLLPSIRNLGLRRHGELYQLQVLILLSNRYRTHLLTPGSFNHDNLEAHLCKSLDDRTSKEYATQVTVRGEVLLASAVLIMHRFNMGDVVVP